MPVNAPSRSRFLRLTIESFDEAMCSLLSMQMFSAVTFEDALAFVSAPVNGRAIIIFARIACNNQSLRSVAAAFDVDDASAPSPPVRKGWIDAV
jgi:hypothetical protein